MVTAHTVFGYGVKLTTEQQRKLQRSLLKTFRDSDNSSTLRQNIWFTEQEDNFFLFDVLEEMYQEVFVVSEQHHSEDSSTIVLTTVSSTSESYDPTNVFSFVALPDRGNSREIQTLVEICKITGAGLAWHFFTSTFL